MNIKEEIFKDYEKKAEYRRPHLGASIIGQDCKRSIWYTFRWFYNPETEGRVLRLFEHGQSEELRMIKNLMHIGVLVFGGQTNFKDGHLSGSCDSFIKIGDESMILECKTMNEKSFNALVKTEEISETHIAQMQIYMHFFKMKKSLYFVINKNNDDIFTIFHHYNEKKALALIEKAHEIIDSQHIPARAHGEGDYRCKMCNFTKKCWSRAEPEKNCRTCINISCERDSFICLKKVRSMSIEEQKNGCSDWMGMS